MANEGDDPSKSGANSDALLTSVMGSLLAIPIAAGLAIIAPGPVRWQAIVAVAIGAVWLASTLLILRRRRSVVSAFVCLVLLAMAVGASAKIIDSAATTKVRTVMKLVTTTTTAGAHAGSSLPATPTTTTAKPAGSHAIAAENVAAGTTGTFVDAGIAMAGTQYRGIVAECDDFAICTNNLGDGRQGYELAVDISGASAVDVIVGVASTGADDPIEVVVLLDGEEVATGTVSPFQALPFRQQHDGDGRWTQLKILYRTPDSLGKPVALAGSYTAR